MWFSRKKKLQRDRDAGLVFRWRGGYAGNRGGMTLAVLLAGGFFVLASIAVNIRVKPEMAPLRHQPSITNLENIDEGLEWWLEKNTPFLDSWYSHQDELGEGLVQMKLQETIAKENEKNVDWRKVELDKVLPETPSVFAKGEVNLPSVKRHVGESGNPTSEDVPAYQTQLEISSPNKGMEARFPETRAFDVELDKAEDWLGETLRYTVYVNAKGEVTSCLPIEWSNDKGGKQFENWINTLRFKPSKVGQEALVLEVTVRQIKREKLIKSDAEQGGDE